MGNKKLQNPTNYRPVSLTSVICKSISYIGQSNYATLNILSDIIDSVPEPIIYGDYNKLAI